MTSSSELFDPTEEHRFLRRTVAEFARKEVEPQPPEHDQKGQLNGPSFRKLAELGVLAIPIPADHGGA